MTQCLEGSIRLAGGSNVSVGRVEICKEGVWGTVCDDYWSTVDAQVVCRQLGHPTYGQLLKICLMLCSPHALLGAIAYTGAHFGQGTGPIHFDDVGCSGSETLLLQCSHSVTSNCVHSEDAGVRCHP